MNTVSIEHILRMPLPLLLTSISLEKACRPHKEPACLNGTIISNKNGLLFVREGRGKQSPIVYVYTWNTKLKGSYNRHASLYTLRSIDTSHHPAIYHYSMVS